MLCRIDEEYIKNKKIIGHNIESLEKKIYRVVDLIFSEKYKESSVDFGFFGIKGTILLYGKPGVGKTTLAYNILNYALDAYNTDVYTINLTEVISENLGVATKNIKNDLDEFLAKKQGVLFIDEFDKICINRDNSDEISELKRMFIEVMNFMDKINYKNRKIVMGCTNVIAHIDDAMQRRFTILEQIAEPSKEDKILYINECLKQMQIEDRINNLGERFDKDMKTMDAINRYFRDIILEYDCNNIKNIVVKKIKEMEV